MIGDYPAFQDMPVDDLVRLMMACSMSNDPTDKAFAKACREEIKRRKPDRSTAAPHEGGK